MFGFLKKKLKGAISKFSEEVEEKGEEEIQELPVQESAEEKTAEPAQEEKLSKEAAAKTKEEKHQAEEKEEKQPEEISDKKPAAEETLSEIEKEKSEIPKEEKKEEPQEKILEESKEKKYILEEDPEEDKKGFFSKLKGRFAKKEEDIKPEEKAPEKEEATKEEKPEKEPEKEKTEKDIQKEEKKSKPISQEKKSGSKKAPEKEKKSLPLVEERPSKEEPVEIKEERSEEKDEKISEEEPEEDKKGFFSRMKQKVVTKKISEQQFEDLFWELEIVLLENNVSVEVIEKIKDDLKQNLVDKSIPRNHIDQTILTSLKDSIDDLFIYSPFDLLKESSKKKPYVICFFGINGSGKTTTIAKFAKMFKEQGKSCVLAAADTFRAAAIDQLQTHADNLGVKLIKHDYGSDAAAVAFDAIKHAKSKDADIVLIDTAGRMHSNVNLMEEMHKIIRIADPDLKLFVGESITGNDCTEQAKKFNETIGIDGIVLSKADIDEKGGAAISVSYVTKKPVLFIGTGQGYGDIKEFDPRIIIDSLGL